MLMFCALGDCVIFLQIFSFYMVKVIKAIVGFLLFLFGVCVIFR